MSDQNIVPPQLDDVFSTFKREILTTINCVQIGRIISASKNQTVEIELQVQRRNGDEIVNYPVLVDCPYFILQGGGGYIDMPVSPNDYCIVLFNDRNIDTWWDTSNVDVPRDRRKHSLSDGMALVGINPRTNVLDIDGSVVRIFGTSGPGTEQFAARENDTTVSSSSEDSTFWTFFTAFFSVITGAPIPEPGNGAPSAFQAALAAAITGAGGVPSSQAGRINSASTEVQIG